MIKPFLDRLFSSANPKHPLLRLQAWRTSQRIALTRTVSLVICLSFLFPILSFAFQAATYPVDMGGMRGTTLLNVQGRPVEISPEWGLVVSTYRGKSDKTVIYIQDLHCNYEVQNNIVQILKSLVERHQLRLIGVEGDSDQVDVSLLSTFPVQKVRVDVGNYFLKRGMITGAEYLAAMDARALKLEGIETQTLYDHSRDTLLEFLSEETQGYCEDLRYLFERLKKPVYNLELAKLDHQREQYEFEQITLESYCNFLISLARQQGLDLGPYPAVKLFAAERRLPPHTTLGYELLNKEAEALNRALRQPLYTSQDQRRLDQYLYVIKAMEAMLNISATEEDLRYYRLHREEFSITAIMQFLEDICYRYAISPDLDPQIVELDKSVALASKFYDTADKRSEAFVENIVSHMQNQKTSVAALITGGFHASQVEDALRARQVSFVAVKPRITSTDAANPYFSLIRNQRTPLEKLLARKEQLIALASRIKAGANPDFIRHFGAAKAFMLETYLIVDEGLTDPAQRAERAQAINQDWLGALAANPRLKEYVTALENLRLQDVEGYSNPAANTYCCQFPNLNDFYMLLVPSNKLTNVGHLLMMDELPLENGYSLLVVRKDVMADERARVQLLGETATRPASGMALQRTLLRALGVNQPMTILVAILSMAFSSPKNLGFFISELTRPARARVAQAAKSLSDAWRNLPIHMTRWNPWVVSGVFSASVVALAGAAALSFITVTTMVPVMLVLAGVFLFMLVYNQRTSWPVKFAAGSLMLVVGAALFFQSGGSYIQEAQNAQNAHVSMASSGTPFIAGIIGANLMAIKQWWTNVKILRSKRGTRIKGPRGYWNLAYDAMRIMRAQNWADSQYGYDTLRMAGDEAFVNDLANVIEMEQTKTDDGKLSYPELRPFLATTARLAIAGIAYHNGRLSETSGTPESRLLATARDYQTGEKLAKEVLAGKPAGQLELGDGQSHIAQLIRAIVARKNNFNIGDMAWDSPERLLPEYFSETQIKAIARLAHKKISLGLNGLAFNPYLHFYPTPPQIRRIYDQTIDMAKRLGASRIAVPLALEEHNDLADEIRATAVRQGLKIQMDEVRMAQRGKTTKPKEVEQLEGTTRSRAVADVEIDFLLQRVPELAPLREEIWQAIQRNGAGQTKKMAATLRTSHNYLKNIPGYQAEVLVRLMSENPKHFLNMIGIVVNFHREHPFAQFGDAQNMILHILNMIENVGAEQAPTLLNVLRSKNMQQIIFESGIENVAEVVLENGTEALNKLIRRVKASPQETIYLAYESLQVFEYLKKIVDETSAPLLICSNLSYGQYVAQPLRQHILDYAKAKGKEVQFVNSHARSGQSHTAPNFIGEQIIDEASLNFWLEKSPHVVVIDGSKNERYPDGFQQFANLTALMNLMLNQGMSHEEVRALVKKSDVKHIEELLERMIPYQARLNKAATANTQTKKNVRYEVQYWTADGRLLPTRRNKQTDGLHRSYEEFKETTGQRQIILINGTVADTNLPMPLVQQVTRDRGGKYHHHGYYEDFYAFFNPEFMQELQRQFNELADGPSAELIQQGPVTTEPADAEGLLAVDPRLGVTTMQLYNALHDAAAVFLRQQQSSEDNVWQDERDGRWAMAEDTKLVGLNRKLGRQAFRQAMERQYKGVVTDWDGTVDLKNIAQILQDGRALALATGRIITSNKLTRLRDELRHLGCTDQQLTHFAVYGENGATKWTFTAQGEIQEDTAFRQEMSQDQIGILERALAALPFKMKGSRPPQAAYYAIRMPDRNQCFNLARALAIRFNQLGQRFNITIENNEVRVFPPEVNKRRAALDMAKTLGVEVADLLKVADSAASIFDNDMSLVADDGFNVGKTRPGVLWGVSGRIHGNLPEGGSAAFRAIYQQAKISKADDITPQAPGQEPLNTWNQTPAEIIEYLAKQWNFRTLPDALRAGLENALGQLDTSWRSPQSERLVRILTVGLFVQVWASRMNRSVGDMLETIGLSDAEKRIVRDATQPTTFYSLAGRYISQRDKTSNAVNTWNRLAGTSQDRRWLIFGSKDIAGDVETGSEADGTETGGDDQIGRVGSAMRKAAPEFQELPDELALIDLDAIKRTAQPYDQASPQIKDAVAKVLQMMGFSIRSNGQAVMLRRPMVTKLKQTQQQLKKEKERLERRQFSLQSKPTLTAEEQVEALEISLTLSEYERAQSVLTDIIQQTGSRKFRAFNVMLTQELDDETHGIGLAGGNAIYLNVRQVARLAEREQTAKLMRLIGHESGHIAGMGTDAFGEGQAGIIARLLSGYELGIMDVINEIDKIQVARTVIGENVENLAAVGGRSEEKQAQKDAIRNLVNPVIKSVQSGAYLNFALDDMDRMEQAVLAADQALAQLKKDFKPSGTTHADVRELAKVFEGQKDKLLEQIRSRRAALRKALEPIARQHPGFIKELMELKKAAATNSNGFSYDITYVGESYRVVSTGSTLHESYEHSHGIRKEDRPTYAGYMRVAKVNGSFFLLVDNGSQHYTSVRPFGGMKNELAIEGLDKAMRILGITRALTYPGNQVYKMNTAQDYPGTPMVEAAKALASRDYGRPADEGDTYADLDTQAQALSGKQAQQMARHIRNISRKANQVAKVLRPFVTDPVKLEAIRQGLLNLSAENVNARTVAAILGAIGVHDFSAGQLNIIIEQGLNQTLNASTVLHEAVEAMLRTQGLDHNLAYIVEQAIYPQSMNLKLANANHYDNAHLRNVVLNTMTLMDELAPREDVPAELRPLRARQRENAVQVGRAAADLLLARETDPEVLTEVGMALDQIRQTLVLGVYAQPEGLGFNRVAYALQHTRLGRSVSQMFGLPFSLRLMLQLPSGVQPGIGRILFTGIMAAVWLGLGVLMVAGWLSGDAAIQAVLAAAAVIAPATYLGLRFTANPSVTSETLRAALNAPRMQQALNQLQQNYGRVQAMAITRELLNVLNQVQNDPEAVNQILEILGDFPGEKQEIQIQIQGQTVIRQVPTLLIQSPALLRRINSIFPVFNLQGKEIIIPNQWHVAVENAA